MQRNKGLFINFAGTNQKTTVELTIWQNLN